MPRLLPVLALAACVLAAGCGQRGELYLRDNPPPGVKPPKTEPTYTPVPYPAESRTGTGTSEKK